MQADTSYGYTVVAQVLDCLADAKVVPLGVRASLYRAVDELRAADAPDLADLAGRISTDVLKLEWAIVNRDVEREQAIRAELQQLQQAWMDCEPHGIC